MKPIALKLSGLHSFREEQEVDFVRLCEGGVFGIFGPTGSGKSTLLDAVTLALYGKVERAANNTQGIMNHAEKQLSVSFCFELQEGERRRRYRVERVFKRAGEHGVRTDTCRLLEATDQGWKVIADAVGEVNAKVEALLGLTHADFTRAVVLPQGKFAEFLTLKGSERREMLQRIFDLERYGDALRMKLARRMQETEARLQAITAEQAGLGDASAEALQAAEEQMKRSEAELARAQRRLAAVEQELEQARRLWEWQQERRALQQQWQRLAEQDAEMEQLATLVARAKEAERLLPYAESLQKAQAAVRRGQQHRDAAEQVMHRTEERQAAAVAAYEAAKAQRATEEPKWLARLEQLQQAHQLAERIAHMARELEALERRRGEVDAQKKDVAGRREELERRSKDLEARQQQRKAEWAQRLVSADERRMIVQAYREKEDIDQWVRRVQEEQEELQGKQRELSAWRQRQTELFRQGQQVHQAAMALLSALRERLAVVVQLQEQVTGWLSAHEALRDERQAALEAARVRRLAHVLAQELQEGQPCPVCGATEHPAPAKEAADETTRQLERQLKQLQQLLQEGETLRYRLDEISRSWRPLIDRLTAELPSMAEAAGDGPAVPEPEDVPEYGLSRQDVPAQEPAATRDLSDAAGGVETSVLRHGQAVVAQLERQLADSAKQVETVVRQIRTAMRRQEEVAVRLQHAEAECQKQAEKVKGLKRQVVARRQAWTSAYPDFTLDDIAARHARLEAMDREAEALRKELEHIDRQRDELGRALEKLKDEEHRLALEWTALDGQIREKRHGWAAAQDELSAKTGGRPLEAVLQHVQQQLNRLRQREQETARERDAAMAAYQQAVQQAAVARQSLTEAEERLKTAKGQWEAQVERLSRNATTSGWTDLFQPEKVPEAILAQEELARYEEKLEQHRVEKQNVAVRLQEVQRRLDGNSLSEEAWVTVNRRHQEAQADVNRWLEARGAAVEAWKTLQEKHRRYAELERQKKEWASLHEKYHRLQQVFRGNVFVEFLAEKHLQRISRDASQRLKSLTRGRYALEIDSGGGFLIRDDANGGVKRPVSSLSGGETFLTSLALALSLSASIQLRGRHPLQFFFLDEGFGMLDQELLDTVVTALERLHGSHMAIGVISHVPELQARLPRRLLVEPAEPGGRGSRVRLDVL